MTTGTTRNSAAGETILEAKFDRRSVTYGRLAMIGIMAITIVGIPFIPFGILFSLWYHPEFLRRMSARLTTRNIEISKGVFFRKEITIPLNRITDVRLHDDPVMRYLGLRGIKVETAGGSGDSAGSEGSLTGVIDSVEFRDAILRQRDIVLGQSGDDEYDQTSAQRPLSAATDSPVLTEIRDILARIEQQGQKK